MDIKDLPMNSKGKKKDSPFEVQGAFRNVRNSLTTMGTQEETKTQYSPRFSHRRGGPRQTL